MEHTAAKGMSVPTCCSHLVHCFCFTLKKASFQKLMPLWPQLLDIDPARLTGSAPSAIPAMLQKIKDEHAKLLVVADKTTSLQLGLPEGHYLLVKIHKGREKSKWESIVANAGSTLVCDHTIHC